MRLKDSTAAVFRRQARRWLAAQAAEAPEGQRTYCADGRRLAVFESAHLRPGNALDAALLVNGDFSCGAGCVFEQPIYVTGHCEIGKNTRLNAVSAEGNLALGASVEARNWVESGGEIEIRPGCRVWGDVISDKAIRLGARCAVGRLFAPEVASQAGEMAGDGPRRSARAVVAVPAPGNARRLPRWTIPGLDPARLEAASADTWFYEGDLYLSEPVALSSHLVTRGFFACQEGSLLEGDVLAGTALNVGEGSLVRGHLRSGEDLVLEARSVFQSDLSSQGRIRLCSGVRGFRADGPVTVAAAGNLVLEDRVVVRGRMESGRRVLSVARERTAPVERRLAAGW